MVWTGDHKIKYISYCELYTEISESHRSVSPAVAPAFAQPFLPETN